LPREWWRLGGVAAILFVVVFVVGVAMQSAPPLVDDPIEEIREDWVAGGQQYLVAGYVLGLGFVILLHPVHARSALVARPGRRRDRAVVARSARWCIHDAPLGHLVRDVLGHARLR
jgi:hypothetical protein